MPPFQPTYDQPVTLPQLRLLEPELLVNEIARLENSIRHLERSNVELRRFASGEEEGADEETSRELLETVAENDETIARQQERITMIRLALEEQVGVDARNPHYTIASAPSANAAPSSAPAGRRAPAEEAQEDGDEVMGVLAGSTTTTGTTVPSRSAGVNGLQGDGGADDDGMYL